MARGSERETSAQQTGVNAARDGESHRQRTLRARRGIARRHQDAESVEITRWRVSLSAVIGGKFSDLWWHCLPAVRGVSRAICAADTVASIAFYLRNPSNPRL